LEIPAESGAATRGKAWIMLVCLGVAWQPGTLQRLTSLTDGTQHSSATACTFRANKTRTNTPSTTSHSRAPMSVRDASSGSNRRSPATFSPPSRRRDRVTGTTLYLPRLPLGHHRSPRSHLLHPRESTGPNPYDLDSLLPVSLSSTSGSQCQLCFKTLAMAFCPLGKRLRTPRARHNDSLGGVSMSIVSNRKPRER